MRWLTRFLMAKEAERGLLLYYLGLFVLLGVGLSLGHGSMAALFLKRYGVQYLPVMYALLSVCTAAVSLTYAAYVDRVPSERLFVSMFVVLGTVVALIWGAMTFTNAEWVYPAYFLVYECAFELLIIHSKLYAEQNFDGLQLHRLASRIFASINIGKMLGGLLLGVVVALGNVANALLVWVALAAISAVLIVRHHKKAGISPLYRPGRKGRGALKRSVEHVAQGLQFFRKTALLRAASFGLFFMIVSSFILNYSIDRVLTETFQDEARLAAVIGWISAFTGATALLVQLFVTGKLLKRFGVTLVGLALPASMVTSFLVLLVSFSMPAALVGIFSRDVVAQAIRKPARMWFLHALPEYMLGRVNALSTALVLPAALLVASGFLLLTQELPVPVYFVAGGLVTSLLYLTFRMRANRAYARELLATLSHRLFLPHRHGEEVMHAGNEELCKELVRGIAGPDEEVAFAYARRLVTLRPEMAVPAIAARLPTASHRARDRLIRLLIERKLPAADLLWSALADTDLRLKATILEALFDARDARAVTHIEPCLDSDNPRIAALGVLGARRYGLRELEAPARQTWERLLSGEKDGENIAGLELLARIPERGLLPRLRTLLEHDSPRVRQAALYALSQYPPETLPEFADSIETVFRSNDPDVRASCVAAFRVLDPEACRTLCMRAIADEHHKVRDAALSLLEEREGSKQAAEILTRWIMENRAAPRYQQSALDALARLRVPREIFERIAASKVKEASTLFHGLQVIRREYGRQALDNAAELLGVILQERVSQVLDLALKAMESFEDRAAIEAIRAGLASRDRRHVAHASGALHNLRYHALCAPLIAIIDHAGIEKRQPKDTRREGLQTAGDVIAWCVAHPDSWLRECAARVASRPLAAEA
jgi:HEAT repeat protein